MSSQLVKYIVDYSSHREALDFLEGHNEELFSSLYGVFDTLDLRFTTHSTINGAIWVAQSGDERWACLTYSINGVDLEINNRQYMSTRRGQITYTVST